MVLFGNDYEWGFYSILVAAVLAYLPITVRVAIQVIDRQFQAVNPREVPLSSPLAARADSAHKNSLETLSLYAAAIIAAKVAGVTPADAASLASHYVIGRALYVIVFLVGEAKLPTKGLLRSFVFGYGCLYPIIALLLDSASNVQR